MTTVVISQPMFFPWVGLFEQIRLADVYVHYVDVQFSKGSFTNRVQVKTAGGPRWLTIPLRDLHLGQHISTVQMAPGGGWRQSHLALLEQAYAKAPHLKDMLALASDVYSLDTESLAQFVIRSMNICLAYFGLEEGRTYVQSDRLGITGAASQRVLDIVRSVDGTVYVTGHGARNYLDHELFESHGVRVEYMDYRKTPYSQLHGEFTPYVSVLDLIANAGRDGREAIRSGTIYWREFLK